MTDQPIKGMIYTDKEPQVKVASEGDEMIIKSAVECLQPAFINKLSSEAAFGLGYKWGYLDSAKECVKFNSCSVDEDD